MSCVACKLNSKVAWGIEVLMAVSMTFNDHTVARYYVGLHDIVSALVYSSKLLPKYAYVLYCFPQLF